MGPCTSKRPSATLLTVPWKWPSPGCVTSVSCMWCCPISLAPNSSFRDNGAHSGELIKAEFRLAIIASGAFDGTSFATKGLLTCKVVLSDNYFWVQINDKFYLTRAKGFWNSCRVARSVCWDWPKKTDALFGDCWVEQSYFRVDEIS